MKILQAKSLFYRSLFCHSRKAAVLCIAQLEAAVTAEERQLQRELHVGIER